MANKRKDRNRSHPTFTVNWEHFIGVSAKVMAGLALLCLVVLVLLVTNHRSVVKAHQEQYDSLISERDTLTTKLEEFKDSIIENPDQELFQYITTDRQVEDDHFVQSFLNGIMGVEDTFFFNELMANDFGEFRNIFMGTENAGKEVTGITSYVVSINGDTGDVTYNSVVDIKLPDSTTNGVLLQYCMNSAQNLSELCAYTMLAS